MMGMVTRLTVADVGDVSDKGRWAGCDNKRSGVLFLLKVTTM